MVTMKKELDLEFRALSYGFIQLFLKNTLRLKQLSPRLGVKSYAKSEDEYTVAHLRKFSSKVCIQSLNYIYSSVTYSFFSLLTHSNFNLIVSIFQFAIFTSRKIQKFHSLFVSLSIFTMRLFNKCSYPYLQVKQMPAFNLQRHYLNS